MSRLFPLLMLLFVLLPICLSGAEIRAMWVMPWDLTKPGKIDKLIDEAINAGQTDLMLEVRYRSDALYTPNRRPDDFPNYEPRSYILADDGFDPLAYALNKGHANNLRIHAWVVAFNATPTLPAYVQINHIFRNHYDWITFDKNKRRMNNIDQFGYFIDPGIPAVQDYVQNVFCDIVSGYPELDGLHLDYIRYPDANLGYHPISMQRYENHLIQYGHLSWNQWRILQVTEFLQKTYAAVKMINPDLILSTAVIANYSDAIYGCAQDWKDWLEKGIVDQIYPMAYHVKLDEFVKQLAFMKSLKQDERIVVGLRAWDANGGSLSPLNSKAYKGYTVLDLIPRISMIREKEMAGVGLFSYDGLIKDRAIDLLASNSYYPLLLAEIDATRKSLFTKPSQPSQDGRFAIDIEVSPGRRMYVLDFYIPAEGTWIWELWDTSQNLVYRRNRYYPQGKVTDFWNGLDDNKSRVKPGSYIVCIYPENKELQYYVPVSLKRLQAR